MTLTEYAKPLCELAIGAVTTDDIVAVLKPIWKESLRPPPAFEDGSNAIVAD